MIDRFALMQYKLRQAIEEDLEICNRIHTENMKGYVKKVYPWNDSLFRHNFNPQEYQIIEVEQQFAGFYKLIVSTAEIYIAEIQIESQYQNRGIGTSLIKSMINQAQLQNKRLWLKVVRGNPAEKLYQRLGFVTLEISSTHKKMAQID